jgi:biotin carboxyl carrier protein
MQLEIKAPVAGTVKSLLAAEGDPVQAGVPLVDLEPEA